MQRATALPLRQNASFILFGALGDLAWRLVVPAIFDLHRKNQLPENFQLIGIVRDINKKTFSSVSQWQ